jgi:hypothetical protein
MPGNEQWLKNGEGDTVAMAEAEDLFFFHNESAGGDCQYPAGNSGHNFNGAGADYRQVKT